MPNENDISITTEMLTMIGEIDRFNGTWEGWDTRLTPAELKVMKRVATIESVGSSNRIEGNKLTDDEIEEIFMHISQKSFRSRDEEEVAGYADLIQLIFDSYRDIPLDENYIKQMHKILLKYSGKDERHRGEYKKDSNRVAAFDASGREIGSIFETASPFDTPRLMRELVEWVNERLESKKLHPILVIGVFVVHFLAIHPFTDGNGRLSRALTVMLMLKSGYSYMPYASMESIIEACKDAYYHALRRTQRTIWGEKVNYEPWFSFFVASLKKQKRNLEAKIADLRRKHDNRLSDTSRAILALFGKDESLSVPIMAAKLNKNQETIRKAVQALAKQGYLTKLGTTRGAVYIQNP